jgi:hypothetical protein
MFRVPPAEGWEDIQPPVPVTWTPWVAAGRGFAANVQADGRDRGRRVALLYSAGGPFACRSCYGFG